jgi:hypothetical protein
MLVRNSDGRLIFLGGLMELFMNDHGPQIPAREIVIQIF